MRRGNDRSGTESTLFHQLFNRPSFFLPISLLFHSRPLPDHFPSFYYISFPSVSEYSKRGCRVEKVYTSQVESYPQFSSLFALVIRPIARGGKKKKKKIFYFVENDCYVVRFRVTVINQQNQANKSTQTEYVYVIRAVRSCPLRKKRVSMQFHINQLASNSDAIYSKTVFASLDLSTFIFRKASDNLIYEKGKGSRSPSYIPTPERHRWKYITPSKNK